MSRVTTHRIRSVEQITVAGVTRAFADTLYPDKAATEAALSVGSEGDLKATKGGVITNVKPGRIDAKVRGLSTTASASANAALLTALAVESGTTGAEIWVGEGEFPVKTVDVATDRARLTGVGTLVNNTLNTETIYITGDDVEISGITVAGDGITTVHGMDVRGARTWIHHVTATDLLGDAFRKLSSAVVRDIRIEHTTITNAARGIILNMAPGAQVIGNTGDRLAGNLVTFWLTANPGAPVDGIVIAGNRGTRLGRMLIEMTSSSTDAWRYATPVIRHNTGHWPSPREAGTEQYGISVTSSDAPTLAQNQVIKADIPAITPGYWGLELVNAPDADVFLNYVEGFNYGCMSNDSDRTHLHHNHVVLCAEGWAPSGASTGHHLHHNHFTDMRDIAISSVPAGSTVHHNRDRRALAWPDDSTRGYASISVSSPATWTEITDNRAELDQATLSLQSFVGLRATGSDNSRVAWDRNRVVSTTTAAAGHGIKPNNGGPSIAGMQMRDNRFTNLAAIFTTFASGVLLTEMRTGGNIANGVTDPRAPYGFYGMASIPALDGAAAWLHIVGHAAAAPTTGFFKVGDIVLNTAPTAGGFLGWVCTAAGNPGTWKTWGAISA